MAHQFDTGLAMPQRTLIRRGVVELLSGLKRSNGGYLKDVVSFGGVVRSFTDEVGIDLLWTTLQGRTPAIAVALGDRITAAGGIGGTRGIGELELLVYFYSQHARDIMAGRHEKDVVAVADDSKDPGLDVMMEHAEELLIGQRLGATAVTNPVGEVNRATASIKQIVFGREEELRTEHGFTLWVQRYQVTVTRSINKLRDVSQLITELNTKTRTSDAEMDPPADPVAEATTETPA